MLSFEWPELLWLLPLPLLVRYLSPATKTRQAALKVPSVESFSLGTTLGNKSNRKTFLLLSGCAWLLLLSAAMRPMWLGDPVQLPLSGRDLLLAVDLSESMLEQDMRFQGRYVDRLTISKALASEFIEGRESDRVGLILFGSQAYLQTPLTFDRATVITLLNESAIGLAGRKTAIGDAIGLAVKRLQDQKVERKVLILITDGENSAGVTEPLKAAELAAAGGLTIYTIGIGRRSAFSAGPDDRTLNAVAKITGGKYFRAQDAQTLKKVYTELETLEPVVTDSASFRPQQSLFYWPLSLAITLAFALFGWRAV